MFCRVTIRLGIGPHSRFAMFCDKHYMFALRIRGVTIMRYINLHFTYLLTYLPGCRPCCHFTVYRIIMAAVWNRAGHYMFALWFLSFLYLFFLA